MRIVYKREPRNLSVLENFNGAADLYLLTHAVLKLSMQAVVNM